MPPDRGRASQACTACRKQKTRCYPASFDSIGAKCLRCERLGQPCSLDTPPSPGNGELGVNGSDGRQSYNDRLNRLENVVTTLVSRLDSLAPQAQQPLASITAVGRTQQTTHQVASNISGDTFSAAEGTPSTVVSTAPVFVIRDVAREVGATQHQNNTAISTANDEPCRDVIDSGLISSEDASSLLDIFLEHYGRWVAFRENTPSNILLTETRKSPLLLCACCLIAVRHTNQEYASRLAPILFTEAKRLISADLLVAPQKIAFFQAALVLSLWSSTIGQALLSIDSWLLSGFALQHCISSDLFSPITTSARQSSLNHDSINRWYIWNHLCLVHLHYCVGTRRKAMLSHAEIEKCGRILDSEYTTNFETRMVAEVNLYWIIYESCSSMTFDLPAKQTLLNSWRQEWKFLFDQERHQFIQMGFHFAQLLMYEQALTSRSAAVRESLLSEMVRLSAAILNLAMDTADMRTQHLSDHIYHIITFAAVTLCRLLHVYEEQLSLSHDINELEQLVLTLVSWLRSIGLPCHVSHTLGDVVSAFFEKLRPNAKPTPTYEEAWAQVDLLNFPDQFGTELFYLGTGHFSPDWDPYVQDPTT